MRIAKLGGILVHDSVTTAQYTCALGVNIHKQRVAVGTLRCLIGGFLLSSGNCCLFAHELWVFLNLTCQRHFCAAHRERAKAYKARNRALLTAQPCFSIGILHDSLVFRILGFWKKLEFQGFFITTIYGRLRVHVITSKFVPSTPCPALPTLHGPIDAGSIYCTDCLNGRC